MAIGNGGPPPNRDKCVVNDCIYWQFGEFETCRYHTDHMKAKTSLTEFMEKG